MVEGTIKSVKVCYPEELDPDNIYLNVVIITPENKEQTYSIEINRFIKSSRIE